MPRRARLASAGAVAGVLIMAITWIAVHDLAVLRRIDANVLGGFLDLGRPRLNSVTYAIASLCDPMPYVLLAAIPIGIALVRGRPRVAVAMLVLLVGANESTELLKPLLAGARDPVGGVVLGPATWPSGHATASMSLALAMVMSVPSRLRPAVGALMAGFTVAIVYSFLELGWHYPSDVLGGFEMACTWSLISLAGLWTYEAHRPALAPTTTASDPRFSIGEALAPAAILVACAVVFGALLVAGRPHTALAYARAHEMFLVGATLIAALSFACASGLNLMLRRPARSRVDQR